MSYLSKAPFWYNINFSNDLLFNGKTTRFLRIHFTSGNSANLNDGYVAIMPVTKVTGSPGNTYEFYNGDSSSFKINGKKLNELVNYCENVTVKDTNDNPFNLYDGSQTDTLLPSENYWQKVRCGGQYAWRIDYDGTKNETVHFIVLVRKEMPSSINHNDIGDVSLGIKSINAAKVDAHEPQESGQEFIEEYIYFDYIDLNIVGYESVKNDSREHINSFESENKKLNANSSALLLRTNPLLSGNVKLTTDSKNDIWLNSFDANDNLSSTRFKKYKVSPTSNYAVDLYKFFDNGQTPADVVFDLKEYDKLYTSTKKEYHLQHDNFYAYGVSQLKSNLYSEEFSFLAPIWLNTDVPDYFVILRADHPVSLSSYQNNDDNILSEILESAKILKTFDIRKGTKLGTYIRNIVGHRNFTQFPINLSLDKETLSTWSGIVYTEGQYADKGEFLYSFISKDRPIKEVDEYITQGFKRNSIICQNLLNLEFLFDDTEADLYSINRYIGLYVSEIGLEQLSIRQDLLSDNKSQTPVLRKNIDLEPYSTQSFFQSNLDGIELPLIDTQLTAADVIEKNKLLVIKNRENSFLRIKDIENKSLLNTEYVSCKLFDTYVNMGLFTGIEIMKFHEGATLKNASVGQCVLTLYDTLEDSYIMNPNDTITIAWERTGKYHKWTLIANETGLQEGDWWDYPVHNIDTNEYQNTFNPKGTPRNVAKAIAGCINQFNTVHFQAVAIDNKVYIVTKRLYEGANDFSITKTTECKENFRNVRFYDFDFDMSDSIFDSEDGPYAVKTNFIGGNSRNRNRACINLTSAKNLQADFWFQSQSNKYSNIKSYNVFKNTMLFTPYLDEPIYDNDNVLTGFNGLNDYAIIELDNDTLEFYTDRDEKINAFTLFKPSLSMLSMYPIQDFDFDFYSTQYAYTPSGELFQYFDNYTLEIGQSMELPFNDFYKVTNGTGVIEVLLNDEWQELTLVETNSIFNTFNPSLVLDDLGRGYTLSDKFDSIRIVNTSDVDKLSFETYLYMKKNTIFTETMSIDIDVLSSDIQKFKGYSGLMNFLNDIDESNIEYLTNNEDYNRFFYGMLLSEYDRLKENNLTDWAVKSKVVPYIHKWIGNGTDVHDNAYRFNLSSAFGKTGFSPDVHSSRNTEEFTHEWFYLDAHPSKFPSDMLENARGYMYQSVYDMPFYDGSKYGDKRTWKDLFKDIKCDYFTKYFSVGYPVETYKNESIKKPRYERYDMFNSIHGTEKPYVIFHGAKIEIDELDSFGNITSTNSYDGYKFSVVLSRKPIDAFSLNKLYDIEIIDNKVFKTMVIVISLFLQGDDVKSVSYTSLYTSNNAMAFDNVFAISSTDKTGDDSFKLLWKSVESRKMENNAFGVVGQYSDVQVQSEIEQGTSTKIRNILKSLYSEYGIDFPEFRPMSAGKLQDVFSTYLLSSGTPPTYLPFSKTISFEGFASQYINKPSNTTPGSIYYHSEANEKPANLFMHDLGIDYTEVNVTNEKIIISDNVQGTYIDMYNLFYNNAEQYYAFVDNGVYVDKSQYDTIRNVFYLNGGESFNQLLTEIISFKNIINGIDSINVTTSSTNGITNEKLFKLTYIPMTQHIKENVLSISKDTKKPAQFTSIDTIGFELNSTNAYEVLFRYDGRFQPARRNVIDFWLNEHTEFNKRWTRDFTLCNTSFASNFINNSTIKNHFYNKVSDAEILRIADDNAYRSLYPLINEVAIDKKTTNVLKSNWDGKCYVKNINASTFEYIDGMNDYVETNTFMGSTVMNVPTAFEFFDFNTDEYTATLVNAIGPNVSALNNIGSQTAIDNGKSSIVLTFDMSKRILRDAIENYAYKELDWISSKLDNTVVSSMTVTEKENYIKKYISTNILELYEISNVIVYAKHIEKTSDAIPVNLNTSESTLLNTGYLKYNAIQQSRKTNLELDLTIFLDTTKYQMFSIGITINRI